MRRIRMVGAVATMVLATARCGGDSTGISSINGPWTLRTVNGAPLPYTMSGGSGGTTELVEDVLTLNVGGTWSETKRVRTSAGGQITTETRNSAGSYSTFGTSITFTAATGGASRLATFADDALTFVETGATSVYRQ